MHTYSVSRSKPYAEQRLHAFRNAVRFVMDKPIEWAIVIDAEGTELFRGKGTKTRVATPEYAGATLIHNHPSGNPTLSLADIECAVGHNLAEIVAVGRAELTILQRPDTHWWPKLERERSQALASRYKRFGDAHAAGFLGARYIRLPRTAFLNGVRFVVGKQILDLKNFDSR